MPNKRHAGLHRCSMLEASFKTHHAMDVVHTNNELLEEPSSLALFQTALLDNMLKHVATCCILHGNCQVLCRQEHLQEQHMVSVRLVTSLQATQRLCYLCTSISDDPDCCDFNLKLSGCLMP